MPESGMRRSPNPHSHRFTIADDEAVEMLISKIEANEMSHDDREKLRQGFETAMEEYRETGASERKAFFHGMLTGYGVALKLRAQDAKNRVA